MNNYNNEIEIEIDNNEIYDNETIINKLFCFKYKTGI